MTDHTKIARIAADHRPRSVRSAADKKAQLDIEIAPKRAKVLLLRGRFRGAEYVRTHVRYVVGMGAEKGEQHIIRNLGAIERTLREIGIDDAAIASEVHSIEGAVRAELWRQILTPDSDA